MLNYSRGCRPHRRPLVGPAWTHVGVISGPSWAILWPRSVRKAEEKTGNYNSANFAQRLSESTISEAPRGYSEDLLGSFWGHLGPSWDYLGALGPSGGKFGATLDHLGASRGHLGPVLVSSWGHLVAVLGPCWAILGHLEGLEVAGRQRKRQATPIQQNLHGA